VLIYVGQFIICYTKKIAGENIYIVSTHQSLVKMIAVKLLQFRSRIGLDKILTYLAGPLDTGIGENSATLQSTQWIINAAHNQRIIQSTPLYTA
jgi:hypothetical protein